MVKVRTGLIVIAVAGATFAGSAVASAAPEQSEAPSSTTEWTDDCLAHHPEWTEEDFEAMHESMEAGDFGAMASTMGDAWGSMAPMMGGGMGHHGWGA